MYFYVYDAFLNNKKYDRLLSEIETRLNEIGINGKINHLSVLTNMKDTIEHGVRHGAKTVVIVGNDHTFSEAANTLAQFSKITLGFIPVGGDEKNLLASQFNIPFGVAACDILSARRIMKIPLGKVNHYFFLISAKILSSCVTIFCDNSYRLTITKRGKKIVSVYNSPFFCAPEEEDKEKQAVLHTVVENLPGVFGLKTKKDTLDSILFHKNLSITSLNESVPILIDDHFTINTPVEISIAQEKIRLIVGKPDFIYA